MMDKKLGGIGGHIPKKFKKKIHKIHFDKHNNVMLVEDTATGASEAVGLVGSYTVAPQAMNGFRYPLNSYSLVEDQGEYPTCVAYSLAGIARTLMYKGTGKIVDFCTQWIYGNRYGLACQTEGMYLEETMARFVRDGVPIASDVQNLYAAAIDTNLKNNLYTLENSQHYYNTSDGSGYTAKGVVNTTYNTVINYARMYKPLNYAPIAANDTVSIKNALVGLSPVAFAIQIPNVDYCMYVAADAKLDKIHYAGETYNLAWGQFSLRPGSHAMIIVGWTTIGGVECWIVRNSWGSYDGDNGHLYIPFNLFVSLASEIACFYPSNVSNMLEFKKSNYYNNSSFSGLLSTSYAKGKKNKTILISDIFNNLTHYINVKRSSVGLQPIIIDWADTQRQISASLFNTLKNGFNDYTRIKYGSNLINIPDRSRGQNIIGTDIWALFDIIEKNI